jgi:hypothetical protein
MLKFLSSPASGTQLSWINSTNCCTAAWYLAGVLDDERVRAMRAQVLLVTTPQARQRRNRSGRWRLRSPECSL